MDLWTTLRVAHRVHSRHNHSRPREHRENCVTHVVGQKCYPCPRLHKTRQPGRRARITSRRFCPTPLGLRARALQPTARPKHASACRAGDSRPTGNQSKPDSGLPREGHRLPVLEGGERETRTPPSASVRNSTRPSGSGPRFAAMAAKRPSGTRRRREDAAVPRRRAAASSRGRARGSAPSPSTATLALAEAAALEAAGERRRAAAAAPGSRGAAGRAAPAAPALALASALAR